MYSGGSPPPAAPADPSVPPGYPTHPTRWALNPLAYQNVSNDRVDWAALAQQWIQMKETAPSIANVPNLAHLISDEKGEAPMEVEQDAETDDVPEAPRVSPHRWRAANSSLSSLSSNSWERRPGPEPDSDPYGWQADAAAVKPPKIPPAPSFVADFAGPEQQSFRPGYWSADGTAKAGNRAHRRRNQNQNQHPHPHQHPPPIESAPPPAIDGAQTLDAAKRRTLPAWIREGLEKMEREKQKQIDRERENKEKEEYMRLNSKEADDQHGDDPSGAPVKSKFDSESDRSEDEQPPPAPVRKPPSRSQPPSTVPLLQKTPEEIMQETMLSVRRNLTEILLEVTNEQILSVCQEELSRKRLQPQASRGSSVASKAQALSTIGGELGLGIYGDSTGESDSEGESDEDGRRSSTPGKQRRRAADITDSQLQETIRRRKQEFEKTSREIEAQLSHEEAALNKNNKSSGDGSRVAPRNLGENLSESGSDGEEPSSNNRNEQNISKQRKFSSERTPPPRSGTKADRSRKHSQSSKNNFESKSSKHSDSNSKRSDRRLDERKSKSSSSKKVDSRRSSNKKESRHRSSSMSSNSGNESRTRRSDRGTSSESNSSRSRSSSSSASSSNRKRPSKRSKRGSSEDSDRYNKSKRDKRDKKSKKTSDRNVDGSDQEGGRDSQSSNRKSRTPERRHSHRSKNSERSRSRSYEKYGSRYYDTQSKHYGSSSSTRHRSKERKDRSRDSRERKDKSRDPDKYKLDKDRYKERDTDRRARSREKDRRGERRDSRRY